MTRDIE